MRKGTQEPYPEAKEGDKVCCVTVEEASWIFNNLTKSAHVVFMYIRAQESGGEKRYEIEPKEIAGFLGCSEKTVKRALEELEGLELIEWKRAPARQKVKSRVPKEWKPERAPPK